MWIKSISIYKQKEITCEFIIEYISIWNEIYSNYKYYIECGKAYLVKYEELLEKPFSIIFVVALANKIVCKLWLKCILKVFHRF